MFDHTKDASGPIGVPWPPPTPEGPPDSDDDGDGTEDFGNGSTQTTSGTNSGNAGVSTRLSGRPDEQYGLAKSLSVMPGDIVRIEVFAKYIDPNETNWQTPLIDLLAMIGDPASGVMVDGGGPGSVGTESFPSGLVISKSGGTSAPKAYLNYVSFDSDDQPLLADPTQTNYIQISDAGKENGTNVPHERLFVEIHVKKAGLMYIYLSNDNVALGGQPVDVFFDDFKVEHVHSKVVQSDDYYPFGLTFNSYQRENSLFNKYLYNGIEKTTDLDFGWYNATYRTLDPSIGRWLQIDPMVDDFHGWSPYNSNFNDPVKYNDPDGDCPPWICGALAKHISENPNGAVAGATGFALGLGNAAGRAIDGVVNLVTNPGGAMDGLAKLSPLNPAGNVEVATNLAITGGEKLDQLQNGNALEKGVVVGEVVGAVAEMAVGTKGAGGLLKTAEAGTVAKVMKGLPDNANVVRGGTNTAELIRKGTGTHPSGVTGVSVECGTCSVGELAKSLPHNSIGVTTVGDVRKAGGDVIRTSGKSANHATMTGLSPQKASEILNPVIKNPNRR